MLKKLILFVLSINIYLLCQYIEGDFIENIEFTDTNIDSSGTIVMNQTSVKQIISSGRILVISFFNPG